MDITLGLSLIADVGEECVSQINEQVGIATSAVVVGEAFDLTTVQRLVTGQDSGRSGATRLSRFSMFTRRIELG